MNSWFLISDSQCHGLGSPPLSPQFLFINFELMLMKSCALSGRLCFSRCQTQSRLLLQIVFEKSKTQQVLCEFRRRHEGSMVTGKVYWQFAAISLPSLSRPFIFSLFLNRLPMKILPISHLEPFFLDTSPHIRVQRADKGEACRLPSQALFRTRSREYLPPSQRNIRE